MGIRTLGVARTYDELWLYHPHTTLGWRRVHRIRREQGDRKVAQGIARRVVDEAGNHVGYQILASPASRVDRDVRSQPSSASISLREMKINAESRSGTAQMSEQSRNERIAAGRAPEDLAERVQRKVQAYPYIGAAKGDILRVWPSGAAEPLAAGV